MSAPRFRERDVVRLLDADDGRPVGCELRVVDVSSAGSLLVKNSQGDGLTRAPERFTLLRRPVRVGDRIRHRETGNPHTYEPAKFRYMTWSDWTHADGTPIDPPAIASTCPRGNHHLLMLGASCPSCGEQPDRYGHYSPGVPPGAAPVDPPTQAQRSVWERRDTPAAKLELVKTLLGGVDKNGEEVPPLISTEQALRLLDAPATAPEPKLDHTTDAVSGKTHRLVQYERDVERQRANRLGDECGALRSERDELLIENATLRRKVERLERGRR